MSAIVFGELFNYAEKLGFKAMLGDDAKRPASCDPSADTCVGCGVYPVVRAEDDPFGMPSGHAQILTFAATFWTIYLVLRYRAIIRDSTKDASDVVLHTILSIIIMWGIVVAVCTRIVISKCHTVGQVAVGASFGVVFGFLAYFIATKVYKDLPRF